MKILRIFLFSFFFSLILYILQYKFRNCVLNGLFIQSLFKYTNISSYYFSVCLVNIALFEASVTELVKQRFAVMQLNKSIYIIKENI